MDEKLSGALVDAIKSDDMSDLIAQIADIVVAATTDSDLLDSIPVLGTLRSLWKAGVSARDAVFVYQVKRLLTEIDRVSARDRKSFAKRLEEQGETGRFGIAVLLLVDKADEARKPTIVGRILAAHMRGDVPDYTKAMRLAWIVNRSYVPDLLTLKQFTPGVQVDKPVADSLFSVGLLFSAGDDGGDFGDPTSGGALYQMSDYAKMLVTYGLADDEE